MADDGTLWVISTRNPDGEPVCEIQWEGATWHAPVEDMRQTALDLVTCAAYAELLIKLAGLGLPPEHVSAFGSGLISGGGRAVFGTPRTITLMPAGSTKRKEAVVLLNRGSTKGMVSATEARAMALRWLTVAEATESDQLVAEALRATGSEAGTAKVFGYLRKLRDQVY